MDKIADMLTTIRNAQAVKKDAVVIPHSKLKMDIAEILSKKEYVGEVSRRGKKIRKTISIGLKYNEDGTPVIASIKRVSKPSQRIYLASKEIRPVQYGRGLQILTTSKGVMTHEDARKEKVGGEVVCEIWR